MAWTDKQTATLRCLWSTGKPLFDIAEACDHGLTAADNMAKRLGLPPRCKRAARRGSKPITLTLTPGMAAQLESLADKADLPLATFIVTHLDREMDRVEKTAIRERVLRERGRLKSDDIADIVGIERADVLKIWKKALLQGQVAPLKKGGHELSRLSAPKVPRPNHAERDARIMAMRPAPFSEIAAAVGTSQSVVSSVVRRHAA